MPLELLELTLEEALRSYSSVKGHRTRCEKEIGNLLVQLLKAQYSSTSEDRINDRLEKSEKHTHRLSDITEYLVTLKYAKARDHRNEVVDSSEILDKCSEEVFTVLHNRHAAAPAAAAPLQAATLPPRLPLSLHLLNSSRKNCRTMLPLPPFGRGKSMFCFRTTRRPSLLPATGLPEQLSG